jgi:hypothetical protein
MARQVDQVINMYFLLLLNGYYSIFELGFAYYYIMNPTKAGILDFLFKNYARLCLFIIHVLL